MKDRTAKILRIFITSDYPVTLEQLEEEFHTSSRTIRNELREINLLLRTNQLPEVKNLRKKGITYFWIRIKSNDCLMDGFVRGRTLPGP